MEIEVKVQVENLKHFEDTARSLGWSVKKERHFERNVLFDYPERLLTSRGCLLRVRETPKGGLLTFKGEDQGDPDFKVRPERETLCEDPKAMMEILEMAGFQRFFVYEKYRSEYCAEDATLCLDELPFGTYLEIEGEPDTIRRVAAHLGIEEGAFLKNSYVDLYRQVCLHQGRPMGDIVFDEESNS